LETLLFNSQVTNDKTLQKTTEGSEIETASYLSSQGDDLGVHFIEPKLYPDCDHSTPLVQLFRIAQFLKRDSNKNIQQSDSDTHSKSTVGEGLVRLLLDSGAEPWFPWKNLYLLRCSKFLLSL